jgi:cytochrome c oxidase subunit 4
MSTVTENTDHTAEHADDSHEHGLSDRQYIYVALILAALTVVEVSTYYVDFGPLFIPTLLVLMVVKFFIVVSYFMHLKFDNSIFSWMFYGGLFLAIGVYVAALATFHFFMK